MNAGEEKAIYLYFDPPYDTKHAAYKTTLKISAENFSDSKQTTANVYGGLYGAVGKADVSASGELNSIAQAVEKTVEISLAIKNDSNSLIQITDMNAYGYNSKFDFTAKSLMPNETMNAKMTLFLEKGFNETQFAVPVTIFTDKGQVIRDIQVDLNAPQKQQEFPISGFLPIGNLKDVILIALIAVVVALVIIVIFKSGGKEEKTEQLESYWKPSEETGKSQESLSEIKRKIKTKPKAKKRK